jgi:hypothetical protein
LIAAQERPYAVDGYSRCSQIAAAVGELDSMLGDDIDLPRKAGTRVDVGRAAQSVVGSLIPFRGVLREITGANDQNRRIEIAIQAGIARRAFLKGYGQARGCRYPARSVTNEAWREHAAAQEQAAAAKK